MEINQCNPNVEIEPGKEAEYEAYLEDYAAEMEHALKMANALEKFHKEVHPEWDDMTLNAWFIKQPVEELVSIRDYLKYAATYAEYAIQYKAEK